MDAERPSPPARQPTTPRPPHAAFSVRLVYISAILLVAVIIAALAWFVVDPAPPDRIRLASGTEDSFYERLGERLAAALARDGVEVIVVPSEGSNENLARLTAQIEGERVDAAFVQGGVGTAPDDETPLRALASLALEPLWVFARGSLTLDDLTAGDDVRIAAGTEGSGTLDFVRRLLAVTGSAERLVFVELNGREAADALMAGEIDMAAFVTSSQAPWIFELLRWPDVSLIDFEHARALARQLHFAREVRLLARVLDYPNRIPEKDVRLLAAATGLVVREELHPAIKQLLLQASAEVAVTQAVFELDDRFPTPELVEYPLDAEAQRYFEHGPTLARRYLPYWGANLLERFWVLIIPIVTLLLPILRFGPTTIDWSIRRRIWRWYKELRELEDDAAATDDGEERRRIANQLDEVEEKVRAIGVPLAFRDDLYRLRTHIAFVRERLRFE